MQFLQGITWIYVFFLLGSVAGRMLQIPIPGSVIGMLLMWLCLSLGWIKLNWVEQGARGLLSLLALFFVPAGVGLYDQLGNWKPLLGILLTTIVFLFICKWMVGKLSQWIIRRG